MGTEKKPLWDSYASWQEAEQVWNAGAEKAQEKNPLRVLKTLPSMPGIAPNDAKNLKWKSLKWMIQKDEGRHILKHVLKKPFTHIFRYLRSIVRGKPYRRDGDFFFYGIRDVEHFKTLLKQPNALFVIGFSYCEKPHECPSGRFNDACIHDPEHPVCRQCFIGKAANTLPKARTELTIIPTIHYIGRRCFELIEQHPDKELFFLITACELTLEMFGDYGNMASIRGIGVRLDGRICNTMRAFELSENGIKPGLTVVTQQTEQRIFDILAHWRSLADR
jgi:hypothetical protein